MFKIKYIFTLIVFSLMLSSCGSDNAKSTATTIGNPSNKATVGQNIGISDFLKSTNNAALRSITKNKYWADAIGKAKINSNGIYFTKNASIDKALDIFFFSKKVGTVGPSAALKIGPKDQIAKIKPLVPIQLTPASKWTKLIKAHKYSVTDMYYLPKGDKTIEVYFLSKRVGSLTLNKSGKLDKEDVVAIYKAKPQKLDAKDYWYKYFSKYGAKNLYFTRRKSGGDYDIYFKDIFVATVGAKKDGFKGPTEQAQAVGPKILSLKGKHPLFSK